MLTFVCYPRCTTCRKAQAWLDGHGIAYEVRDIKQNRPNAEELSSWHEKSSLELKRFFNTSGTLYRSMGIKDRLLQMTEHEKLELLASDGMLVKRPLLVSSDFVLVGFNEEKWAERLL